MLAKQSKISMI
uniref:Uncharacterized protein n=1 Tax=Arundo donax TaxID=35708 RepID=A0A0A8YZ84_ARUDO